MGLFILQETPVGYALFKSKKSKKSKGEGFAVDDDSVEGICQQLKLKEFHKFDSAATALEQAAALVEGKVTPRLATLLDSIKDESKATLAVADPKLATAINKLPQLDLKLVNDSSTADMYRAIRSHLPSLIPGLLPEDVKTMSLGLSHSLSRHKLKFSTDKVDTMIIQAISLLDDLDKELNVYAMRVKEWYGWHFPEMARIVNDNLAYAKIILKMGMRTSASTTELSEILPEEIEGAVKGAAEVSMGTEITEQDLDNIKALAEQVVSFSEYRIQLSSYLANRMEAIAPNLTALVGDLVGARLIAHAGSLMNLAKSPASTIQILGAEKALFRALKTKHDTPKYGLIYHSSLIGQATGKNKGKIARLLATKAALGLRVDALADWSQEGDNAVTDEERSALGVANRVKLERRLAALEGRPIRAKGVAIGPNGTSDQPSKWEVKEARKYNADADGLDGDEPAAKKSKKEKKSKLIEEIPSAAAPINGAADSDDDSEDSDVDEEMEDADSDESEDEPAPTPKKTSKIEVVESTPSKKSQKKDAAGDAKKSGGKDKSSKKPKLSPEEQAAKHAEEAGLPLKRYLRKLERGEISFDAEGKASSISKKDIKKEKKAKKNGVNGDAAVPAVVVAVTDVGSKRKRSDEDQEPVDKAEKKRRKEAKKAMKAAGL